jgi:hypothetical protein
MSWRPIPTCRYCGQSVGEMHWQLFEHITCPPPATDVSPEALRRAGWHLENTINRVGHTLERLRTS